MLSAGGQNVPCTQRTKRPPSITPFCMVTAKNDMQSDGFCMKDFYAGEK